jgi:hypothetical protein
VGWTATAIGAPNNFLFCVIHLRFLRSSAAPTTPIAAMKQASGERLEQAFDIAHVVEDGRRNPDAVA